MDLTITRTPSAYDYPLLIGWGQVRRRGQARVVSGAGRVAVHKEATP